MNRILVSLFVAFLLLAGTAWAQKELPPEGGQPKDFTVPQSTNFVLGNGLKVTLVPYGTVPKVTVNVVIRAGHTNESADEVWLSDLTGEWLKEGAGARSAQTLARDAAKIGGSISVSVGDDRTFVAGDALGEFAPDLIGLLADVVRAPKFPESELPRLKNNYLRRISVAKADPQTLALERFRTVLYGDHPYGRTLPTEAMVNGYTVEKARKFHAENYGAVRSHIFVAGVFDATKTEAAIKHAFADWARGSEPVVNIPKPVSRRAVYIVDRPGAAQSTIYMGLPVADPSSPDWIPMSIANSLLGGSFASRITTNIRENKGYTYSPFSSVSARLRDAYWLQVADVSTDVTGASLKEIFYEIDRLANKAPAPEEVKGIQNYEAGIFVLRNSMPSGIIGLLSFMDLHGLPAEYLANYIKTVHQVTPEQVQQLTKKYIRPEEMTIVIAGDAKKIEKQAAAYGKIVK
jgi:predicted Zn-dependent peptidase